MKIAILQSHSQEAGDGVWFQTVETWSEAEAKEDDEWLGEVILGFIFRKMGFNIHVSNLAGFDKVWLTWTVDGGRGYLLKHL